MRGKYGLSMTREELKSPGSTSGGWSIAEAVNGLASSSVSPIASARRSIVSTMADLRSPCKPACGLEREGFLVWAAVGPATLSHAGPRGPGTGWTRGSRSPGWAAIAPGSVHVARLLLSHRYLAMVASLEGVLLFDYGAQVTRPSRVARFECDRFSGAMTTRRRRPGMSALRG